MKRLIGVLTAVALLAALAACGGTGEGRETDATAQPEPTSAAESTPAPSAPETPDGIADGATEIALTFGNTVVNAELEDGETTRAFLDLLPLTLTMSRYGDREYYASIGELPEGGEAIDDFENGDVTYYTTGQSLAIFFGNADSSDQGDLIRMGKITSDLSLFDSIANSVSVTISPAAEEGAKEMADYDFSVFSNVELTGIDLADLNEEQLAVLYQQARYCQAMTEADVETMGEIVADDSTFTHMSGTQQTKEEYFADVESGSLRYYTIGMENPVVEVDGDRAGVTFTSVLNANAYGAEGTYRMSGTHWFENRDGVWISVNNPDR